MSYAIKTDRERADKVEQNLAEFSITCCRSFDMMRTHVHCTNTSLSCHDLLSLNYCAHNTLRITVDDCKKIPSELRERIKPNTKYHQFIKLHIFLHFLQSFHLNKRIHLFHIFYLFHLSFSTLKYSCFSTFRKIIWLNHNNFK